jgi:hypothetical protein
MLSHFLQHRRLRGGDVRFKRKEKPVQKALRLGVLPHDRRRQANRYVASRPNGSHLLADRRGQKDIDALESLR